jgi:hypothetical protein
MHEQLTLHVGVPRTGTTTIQSFLAANRQRLCQQGTFCLGPGSLQSYPQVPGYCDEDRLRRGLDELKQRLASNPADRIVWSNESFSHFDFVTNAARNPKIIERELPAARHRVVIYLRRQDHFLRSAYLQWGIKYKYYPGPFLDFKDWMRQTVGENFETLLEAGLDYSGLIQPWADVFGRENLVIRPFERGQFLGGDLLHDFCSAAGLPESECVFDVADQNVSFNMELYDMLRMYSSVFEQSPRVGKMRQFIEAEGKDDFYSSEHFAKFAIPTDCRLEILERCEESNRRVARELLGREDGVLFREPWPVAEEPYQAYGGLITEKLVPILLHMLQKQDERIVELDQRLHKFETDTKQPTIADTARRIVGKMKRGVKTVATLGK